MFRYNVGGKHILVTQRKGTPKAVIRRRRNARNGGREPCASPSLEMGLTAVSQTMEFRWAPIDAKTTEVRYARLEHGAKITIDTDAGYRAQVADAKAHDIPISSCAA